MANRWQFTDEKGSFELEMPHHSSTLYFPLANEAGMMSSVTPTLAGDIKTGQNTFFTIPVSADDLHNMKSSRNFWLYIHGKGPWSAAGVSCQNMADRFAGDLEESVKLQAGFLWHKVIRDNRHLGISSVISSFVPADGGPVELMRVDITNMGTDTICITPTAAIPVYGRSADNVRDHRHVTGLLNRIRTVPEGIDVQPAMTFDERGHRRNTVSYHVFGADGEGNLPVGMFPVMEGFIGEGGGLDWPEAIVRNSGEFLVAGESIGGYEAMGALRFADVELAPGQLMSYIIVIAIADSSKPAEDIRKYLSVQAFERHLAATSAFWEEKLGKISFGGREGFGLWMKWVTLQPVLRRLYGCSFLPHHDYGKGGRGWRDLWQDCLALLLLEPEAARPLLLGNFGGVRMDGTNATIIGQGPGEFLADRNNISRVWSDHGVWPMFTTLLYLNMSGDFRFLFERQSYFKDSLVLRAKDVDSEWTPEYGSKQKTTGGEIYKGTIMEHLLLQNLTAFYNAGEHNNIRLENADWNDALDLGADRGETVAFTSFYAGNLMELSKLLTKLGQELGTESIELARELLPLLDTLGSQPVDYDSAPGKRAALLRYCEGCRHDISGEKVSIGFAALAADLKKKAQWMMDHIRENERVKTAEGFEWFNGYYDNSGQPVEGEHPNGVRMTLTGQVFPLMMGVATDTQAKAAAAACRRYLYDEGLGGYRLNTDFKEVKLDLGRCFGFAFGHKENGAVFSHMAVMYACALYRRGLVAEGYDVIRSLYSLSTDFEKARIYPGIPEYFNGRGRGMYHYLTGSASWLLLVMLTDVYGVRGRFGDLVLDPKLLPEQFSGDGRARVQTQFAGRRLAITYSNNGLLGWGSYEIGSITVGGKPVAFERDGCAAILSREAVQQLVPDTIHDIEVILLAKG